MRTNTPRTNWRMENKDELATKVIKKVAQANNIDPVDLGLLSEAVDPEALNDLVTRSPGAVQIKFEYERHTVTVRGDGHIHIE